METTHNYLFLSDLHVSEGRDPDSGKFSRIEDFFQDEAFARFIVYHVSLSQDSAVSEAYHKPWKLVINGDIWDFLQVVKLPPPDHPIFTRYGVELTPRKRRYGLGTSEPETVWKLRRIAKGHPLFFEALGWFLAHEGNELVLMKGNHDVEIYWPKVQQATRYLINTAYRGWYQAAAEGRMPDSPLVFQSTLPAELTGLEEKIQFPPWYNYEPELFYVEHGNQYDPYNFFTDFFDPLLPDRPHLIELPRGSFFVRYLFNKVENIHPFADNIKPLTRYINWVISQEFWQAVELLLMQNFGMTWQALRSLWSKRGTFNQALPPNRQKQLVQKSRAAPRLVMERRRDIIALHDDFREQVSAQSGRTYRRTLLGLGLRLVAILLLVFAFRDFVGRDYSMMTAYALSAVLSFAGGTYLWRDVDNVENYASLQNAAQAVSEILNRDVAGQSAAVRYHVFGHDHFANLVELDDPSQNKPGFRQWYVNTGSWVPAFNNDEDRLTRADVQLAFFRLVPGLPDFDAGVPELMEWRPEENRPKRIRALEVEHREMLAEEE